MDRPGFHDVLFPQSLSLGARGGPERRTDVINLASGAELRRGRWAGSRRRWDVRGGIRSFADAENLLRFFEGREGRRFAFRFRDPFDHHSGAGGTEPAALDQPIGQGDGATDTFSLVKTYGSSVRQILLPVSGSVKIAVDGAEISNGWTFSDTGSAIVFDDPPADGAVLTAGFLFDTPARFDDDRLEMELGAQGTSFPALRLAEVRL